MKQATVTARGGSLFEGYITAMELCKQIGQMKGGRPIARRASLRAVHHIFLPPSPPCWGFAQSRPGALATAARLLLQPSANVINSVNNHAWPALLNK